MLFRSTLVIANSDYKNDKEHWVRLDSLPLAYNNEGTLLKQIFSSENAENESDVFVENTRNVRIWFKKGEVKIFEIRA